MGVGFNDPSSLQSWALEESFQFEVWEDQNRELAVHYGAGTANSAFPKRISFLLDRSGEVLLEYTKNVDVGTHPAQVLSDSELLFGGD